ncbi:MAG: hypothetical protein WKF57_06235 [Nakamurella sp.]
MNTHTRVHAGIPTGGQFAASARSEAEVSLDCDPSAGPGVSGPASMLVVEHTDRGQIVRYPEPLPDEDIFTAPTGDIRDFDPAEQQRLMGMLAGSGSRTQGDPFIGSKYSPQSRSAAEIAKAVRADFKAAQSLRAIPPSIKIRVTSSTFAGGQSVDVHVENIPERDLTAFHDDRGYVREGPTQEANDLRSVLDRVHQAYQRDGSDTMSDHWDVTYYGSVTFHGERRRDHDALEKASKAATNPHTHGAYVRAIQVYRQRDDARDQRRRAAQELLEDHMKTYG